MNNVMYLLIGILFGINLYLLFQVRKLRKKVQQNQTAYNFFISQLDKEARDIAKDFTDIKQF